MDLNGVISSIRYTGDVWSLVKKQKFEKVEIGAGKGELKMPKIGIKFSESYISRTVAVIVLVDNNLGSEFS